MAEVMRRRAAVLVLLVLSAVVLPATLGAQEAARRITVFFEVGAGIPENPALRRFLYESLLVALHRENPRTEFVDAGSGTTDAARADLARSSSSDAWLSVTVDGDADAGGYRVAMRSVFLYTGQRVLDLSYAAPVVASERSQALRLWNRGARAVSQAYSTVSQESSVVIRGEPGTEIVGLTATTLRMQQEELRVSLPQPGVYSFVAESNTHFPQPVDFFLGGRETEVLLNQDRRSRVLLSLYGQEFSYLGVDVSVMLRRPYVFARAGFYTFGFGVVPFVDRDSEDDGGGFESPELIVSEPLTNLRLLVGTYWNGTRGLLRVYTAAGPLVRLLTTSAFTGLEPIAPWGVEAVNGIEFFPRRKVRVFFEHSPTLMVAAEPDSLRAQFFDYEGPDPIYLERNAGYLDLASFRLGVRFQW